MGNTIFGEFPRSPISISISGIARGVSALRYCADSVTSQQVQMESSAAVMNIDTMGGMSNGTDMMDETISRVACCLCGISIVPNEVNMCGACLSSTVDITEGIDKQSHITYCKGCGRYQKPPWITAELESPELLALCLQKIKGLKLVKLVDAAFIWTEPHSRRIKVRVKIRKPALHGIILEQSFTIEFVVDTAQCEQCQANATEHGVWKSVVQVRQKVPHQRTFLYLEQLMIKHGISDNVLRVTAMPMGLDFYFTSRSASFALLDFLSSVAPLRSKQSKRLISQDFSDNTVNYKYTLFVEIVPICKYDLIFLPPSFRSKLGGLHPLLIVSRVSNQMHLQDYQSLDCVQIEALSYWKHAFAPLASFKDLIQYVILDVEEIRDPKATQGKLKLCEVTCAREKDFGVNDTVFHVKTHLGNLLHPGDYAAGYDITCLHTNNEHLDKFMERNSLPEVILVKKVYPSRKNRSKKRKFALKVMPKEVGKGVSLIAQQQMDIDRELFLQDIEEDTEMRKEINLYKRTDVASDTESECHDDGFPQIALDELLNDLVL